MELFAATILLLVVASGAATIAALWHRSWMLMALAALLSLPFCFLAQVAYLLLWLVPPTQLAMAIALRWRLGVAGWIALLVAGLTIGLVGGPGSFLVHRDLVWVFPAGLLVGLLALVPSPPF